MDFIRNIIGRLISNPKSTAGGLVAGNVFAAAGWAILQQAGCDFNNVQWMQILGILFGGPALVGGLLTDNNSGVTPILTPSAPASGVLKSLALLAALGLLGGCTTYAELGDGKVMRTLVTEERSMFGTNAGFMQLQECKKSPVFNNQTQPTSYEYIDCTPRSGWVAISSQGQGGQVVGGALTGLGFGLGSAFSGATGASSSATSSVVSGGGKGH